VRRWRGKAASLGTRRSPRRPAPRAPGRFESGSLARIELLSWNLFHGRSQPPSGRSLFNEFARALDGWSWDVALLQEVPPWWPDPLARATGATARRALTSRNQLLFLRRAISARNPDLLKSNGGGANAILVRRGTILEHRERELTRKPERRVLHGIALRDGGWVTNIHGSTHPPEQRRADLYLAAETALGWAGGQPLVFAGDLNSLRPQMPGLKHVAGHHVDHVMVAARPAKGKLELLEAGPLSDHKPLRVQLA
jgi:endonuclease/exonuclease/phosphatase family metal-dependent hydrolase